ncbi:ATPase [Bacteroidia bacterium]|nr:ATPase [Bacteroidia bacterium]
MGIFRHATPKLEGWKNSANRKPLVIYGMRQVGKTWLMREFGQNSYKQVAYFYFDKNERLQNIFQGDINVARIIQELSIEAGMTISSGDTLIIFDEVQECPAAFSALKSFNETAPEYHIMAAGSFLGVMSLTGTGVPVGQYDSITIHPMTFLEFLEAIEPKYIDIVKKLNWKSIGIFHDELISLLQQYFYVGGMPEAVKKYAETKSFAEVRNTQNLLLDAYYGDFARHVPKSDIVEVRNIWNSVPLQLGKENKRFLYSEMKKGSRGRDYADALQWLKDTRLIHIINCVSLPNIPLKVYEEPDLFKIYMSDIGLLSAQTGLDAKSYLDPENGLFSHYKGMLAEQFVLQELLATNDKMPIYYWANGKSTAEIEFIVQYDGETIPIEVKAGKKFKLKSLDKYLETFHPNHFVKTSQKKFSNEKGLAVPLYMIGSLTEIIDRNSEL